MRVIGHAIVELLLGGSFVAIVLHPAFRDHISVIICGGCGLTLISIGVLTLVFDNSMEISRWNFSGRFIFLDDNFRSFGWIGFFMMYNVLLAILLQVFDLLPATQSYAFWYLFTGIALLLALIVLWGSNRVTVQPDGTAVHFQRNSKTAFSFVDVQKVSSYRNRIEMDLGDQVLILKWFPIPWGTAPYARILAELAVKFQGGTSPENE